MTKFISSSHSTHILTASILASVLLVIAGFPSRSQAQFRPSAAPGFEISIFADPTNVPDFVSCTNQSICYTGPLCLAFDSRGRLFVGTGAAKILILIDTNEDGRADQVKTFATGLPQPFGLEFRSNGDLYASSNIVSGAGRVLRLRDTNGDDVADDIAVIVDNLPSDGDHQTNKIKFGPDGLLYVAQGSSTDAGTPDPGHPGERPLNASILRFDVDNPQVSVFATGLRNPFGIAFDHVSGQLFATDIGAGDLCQSMSCPPDTAPLDGISWIFLGGKYGFPGCEGIPDPGNPACTGVTGPVQLLPRHITPTSIDFYTGPQAADSANQMLVTLLKHLGGVGGDLRRYVLSGNAATGFQTTEVNPPIADFDVIDPDDGPVDTAIDPITGDIYVARFDPVHHFDITEHHNFIYRIHRTGSDALPFIGPPKPTAIKAGSAATTLSFAVRHIKTGAVVFDVTDNIALATRQGSSNFELLADLPASAIAGERTITLEVRNADGGRSNQEVFTVTKGDPNPPPDKSPQITSMFVYKKKRANVIAQLFVGMAAKKFRLVVDGTDFDAGAQLLVNNAALQLDSSSSTELVGVMTNSMVAAPGDLVVQVRNSTGETSNIFKLTVMP